MQTVPSIWSVSGNILGSLFFLENSIYSRRLAFHIGNDKYMELDVEQQLCKFTVSRSSFPKPFDGPKQLDSTANGWQGSMSL